MSYGVIEVTPHAKQLGLPIAPSAFLHKKVQGVSVFPVLGNCTSHKSIRWRETLNCSASAGALIYGG